MKRSIALLVAGSLTAIVGLVFSVSALAAFMPATQPIQNDSVPPVEIIENQQVTLPQTEPVDTAATAQTLIQQTEASFQEQETSLRAEVTQRQQTITELDGAMQATTAQLNTQIEEFQTQIDQKAGNIQAAQANVVALQQAIQNDDAVYQNELAKMTAAENQLRQELEAASGQLNVAYQELTRRQALAQQAAIRATEFQSSSGGGHSSGGHDDHHEHEDDDHGEHEGHDDDD